MATKRKDTSKGRERQGENETPAQRRRAQAAGDRRDRRAPEPEDKTSDPWRIWKLRNLEYALKGKSGPAFAAAKREARQLLVETLARFEQGHVSTVLAVLADLIIDRQREEKAGEERPAAVFVENIAAAAHEELGHRPVFVTLTTYTSTPTTPRLLEDWRTDGEVFGRLLDDRRCDPDALAAFDGVLGDGIMGPYFEGVRADELAGLYVLARIRHEGNIPVSVDATVDALNIMREKLFGGVNEEISADVTKTRIK